MASVLSRLFNEFVLEVSVVIRANAQLCEPTDMRARQYEITAFFLLRFFFITQKNNSGEKWLNNISVDVQSFRGVLNSYGSVVLGCIPAYSRSFQSFGR